MRSLYLKDFIPPVLTRFVRSRMRRHGWHGDFSSWDDARKASSGYDDVMILENVSQAVLKVKRGKAAYERDSVLFDRIEYSWPLVAGLLWIASRSNNRLSVLDFGGSLGTSYFQNEKFLSHLDRLRWSIVEQKLFVDRGKQKFEDECLKFYHDISMCVIQEHPNVLLCSSVLSYLEKPFELLNRVVGLDIPYIIIDRTLFLDGDGGDRLTIQSVPPSIYTASYPCWIFNREKFLKVLTEKFSLVEEFDAHAGTIVDLGDAVASFKGFIFQSVEKNKKLPSRDR